MTSKRGRPGTYREPRPRGEIAMAVLGAVGVLVVTAVLILLLQPDDDSPSTDTPATTAPATTLPSDGSTTLPATTAPVTTAPATTAPAISAP